jgi:mannose-1-phosphate guanylyltransferase
MANNRYAVIMSGGRGERFWPLSTIRKPKQLLSLVGGKPLLAAAVDRLAGFIPQDRVFIVTSRELVGPTREIMPDFPADQIVGEPCRRDTAAAVALGSVLVAARDPGAAFCVLTADQVIPDTARFQAALARCFALAEADDTLVTMGIAPAFPSTGFGYIEAGDALPGGAGEAPAFKAVRFVEKPDAATAAHYVESGRFYWNSGMFIWTVAAIRNAFRLYRPPLAALCDTLDRCRSREQLMAQLPAAYEPLERISIDYAVMEKAPRIVVVKGDFGWDDVGSWPALANHFPADAAGNVLVGPNALLDAHGNILVSPGDRLTVLLGVDDLIVVQAPGVTLVCRKDRAQDVKKIVQMLDKQEPYKNLM